MYLHHALLRLCETFYIIVCLTGKDLGLISQNERKFIPNTNSKKTEKPKNLR